MNFLELVKKRQSDRKYKSEPVEKKKIERCIEAARLAPSACNSQPWKFVIIDNTDLKNKIAGASKTSGMKFNRFTDQAPVIIALINEGSNFTAKVGSFLKNKHYNQYDIGIAAEHFCLQAVEEGLGTCMIGWFDEKKTKKLLGVPNNKRIDLLITVGYPDGKFRKKIRKTTDEIISYNRY